MDYAKTLVDIWIYINVIIFFCGTIFVEFDFFFSKYKKNEWDILNYINNIINKKNKNINLKKKKEKI